MSVLLSVKFNESKGGMMVDIRVNGNGRETPEELNRAMAMAKAASAVMKEMHGGEIVMENLNDNRVCEVMARGY
ncbi:hypothetical protein FOI36_18055 [Salmonella enterica]|uniref:Uncharacterized protein n=2 Tax=Salmonella enterica TaxID=28901 RepID=A0A743Q0M0_SALER|nr:hypothetical protein [Salmonella enterica]ECC1626682.1 hypothetical protein [Salmonella enterica subsp. salamae]EDQ9667628.1 hypothetical protein [Salmonella enterica subsp. enterica serovar Bredeney]EGM7164871.1 hypothetical protein [Salmonella enterica subsp. enterica serovar Pomona]ECE6361015.1 hypothetical protein [Salmonella enterica subsp. salamae]